MELNKIYCMDCLDGMRQMEDNSVDLVLTDPPYGIKMDKGFEGFGEYARRKKYDDEWDSERPEEIVFNEIIRVSKNQIIFGGNFFTDILPQSNHWIVWDKKNTMPTFGDCELAWTSIQQNSINMFSWRWNGCSQEDMKHKEERFHPTQKPVPLFEWILNKYSKQNDLILDPFIGSGTTALACLKTQRRFIGFELEQKYVDIANKRCKPWIEQERLI